MRTRGILSAIQQENDLVKVCEVTFLKMSSEKNVEYGIIVYCIHWCLIYKIRFTYERMKLYNPCCMRSSVSSTL